jgi:hypothetical protein
MPLREDDHFGHILVLRAKMDTPVIFLIGWKSLEQGSHYRFVEGKLVHPAVAQELSLYQEPRIPLMEMRKV